MRTPAITSILLGVATTVAVASGDTLYRLPLGDPARKDREVPVVLDTMIDTTSGRTLTPDDLPAALGTTRLLLIGESHTSVEFHRVQLQVLRSLQRTGRRVLIGVEMYPYTAQPSLDAWNAGQVAEGVFVEQSHWYEHWGYHWNYYRDIFLFAREAGIPITAVNAPRSVVAAVRKKGFVNLTPEEAAHIPTNIEGETSDHMAFFKASISDGDSAHPGMSDDALKGMLAAQSTWDATMGWNAVKALKASNDPNAIMVVLVGSGHVAYGVGIQRQARRWLTGGVSTLVPVPVEDDKGTPITLARASYADIVYGVAGERESAYPSLGLSSVPAEGGRSIIDVQQDTPAAAAGLAVGDVIATMDGQPITTSELFSRLMAGKLWGDVVRLGILRGGVTKTIDVPLRRRAKRPARS
jgi:uncharacterized iron-regulated protein